MGLGRFPRVSASSDLRVPEDQTHAPAAPLGPSGWHVDPWRRHAARFFDGHRWTEHVADGGVSSVDSAPVAGLPRSRPVPPQEAPPDGVGPRVLEAADLAAGHPGLDHPLLLVDLEPDADGIRRIRTPDEVLVGRISARRSSLLTRLGRGLVSTPGARPSRLVVVDVAGAEHIRLHRPGRRTRPVVDVEGPDGSLGTITAESVRQGLSAIVVDGSGHQVGRLEQLSGAGSLRVVDGDDEPLARLTPVWDIPGTRAHLPPGVVLADRRPPDGGGRVDPAAGQLLMAALLVTALLLPPGDPVDG